MSSSKPLRGSNLDCTGGSTSISPQRGWGRFTLGLVTLRGLELNWTQRGCLSINWHLICLDFQNRVHPMYYIIYLLYLILKCLCTELRSQAQLSVTADLGTRQRLLMNIRESVDSLCRGGSLFTQSHADHVIGL